jgi:hypothetical protein
MSTRPENIGIKAIEIYFPNQVRICWPAIAIAQAIAITPFPQFQGCADQPFSTVRGAI